MVGKLKGYVGWPRSTSWTRSGQLPQVQAPASFPRLSATLRRNASFMGRGSGVYAEE